MVEGEAAFTIDNCLAKLDQDHFILKNRQHRRNWLHQRNWDILRQICNNNAAAIMCMQRNVLTLT